MGGEGYEQRIKFIAENADIIIFDIILSRNNDLKGVPKKDDTFRCFIIIFFNYENIFFKRMLII